MQGALDVGQPESEGEIAERLQTALEAGQLGTFRWDRSTGIVEWDARTEALFGFAPGTFDGTYEAYVSALHPDDRANVVASVEAALQNGGRYTTEHRVVWPDGTVHWLSGAGVVSLGPDGAPVGAIGCVRDITVHVHAAEADAIHRERLEILGTVNDALNVSRTRGEAINNVTRACVPDLGDWCALWILPESATPGDGTRPEVEVAHVDPDLAAKATALLSSMPLDPEADHGVIGVLRSGLSELHEQVDEALFDRLDVTDEQRAVIRQLGFRSVVLAPLIKRGRIRGVLQVARTDDHRPYDVDDVALVRAISIRVASSLENLRLMDRQREIALTLQRGLLPQSIPEIPRASVAVGYWAAGEGTEVGGDFYDLFEVAPGRWGAVVGDVCGKGAGAASLTSLARHSIRMSAWHGDDPPAVLTWLNRALFPADHAAFCTAVYTVLEESPDGFQVTSVSGGHPLPLVCRADGGIDVLGGPGTMLGCFPDPSLHEARTTLRRGDMLVLYTDGITDVPPPGDLSDEELQRLVADVRARCDDVKSFVDEMSVAIDAIVPLSQRSDDIALLAIAVTD